MIRWLYNKYWFIRNKLYFNGCHTWLEIDMGGYSLFIGVYDGPLFKRRQWSISERSN